MAYLWFSLFAHSFFPLVYTAHIFRFVLLELTHVIITCLVKKYTYKSATALQSLPYNSTPVLQHCCSLCFLCESVASGLEADRTFPQGFLKRLLKIFKAYELNLKNNLPRLNTNHVPWLMPAISVHRRLTLTSSPGYILSTGPAWDVELDAVSKTDEQANKTNHDLP